MQQKTSLLIAIVLLLAITGLVWSKAPTKSEDAVTIGVIASLTGPLAEFGEAVRNGFTLANEDLQQTQSKKISFVFEDSAYAPDKAIAAYRKLTDFDKVGVVLNWGAPTSEALVPIANTSKTPFFAFTIVNGFSTKNDVVRLLNQPKDFIDVLWPHIRSQGWKSIGVVKTKNLFLDGMYESLVAGKQPGETIVLIDEFQGGDKDFRTSIQKARGMQLDAIGDFLLSGQVSQFEKQSKELGLNLPVIGTDFFEGEKEIAASQGAMEGAVYPHLEPSAVFKARYLERFGNVSQLGFAANAYDVAMIFGTRVDYASPETIQASVKSLTGYAGALGTYPYVETASDRYLRQPVTLMTIRNGKPERLR